MKTLRKRLVAKQYGYKYKRFADGSWNLTKLDLSYGFGYYEPVSNEDFLNRLKRYRQTDDRIKNQSSKK